MDYEKLGLLFLGLLNLGWLIYSNTSKSKNDTSAAYITDRAKLTDDLANLLHKTTEAREKLELENNNSQRTLNKFELENGKLTHLVESYEQKLDLQEKTLESFRRDVDNFRHSESKLKDELEKIRRVQVQHTENERLLKNENDELKIKIKELHDGQRELVRFYEKQIGEKERMINEKNAQIKQFGETTRKQGADIEKLKRILEENGLTVNFE